MKRIAVLLSVAGGSLWAAGFETQHALDVTLPLKQRMEVILHSRVRTQPGGLGFYQFRAGPIVSWNLTARLSVLSGYYYAQQERRIDNDFIGGHRFFAGGEIRLIDTNRFSVDQRFVAERFLSDAADDFNRYRSRTRINMRSRVAPYTTHEIFADARGWRSNRHSAGIRWSFLPLVQLDLGYLYEQRRADVGPNRHMWLTSIHLKKPSRRADPEI